MRQTVQKMFLFLLTGAIVAGCEYRPLTPEFLGFEGAAKKTEKEKPNYLEDLVDDRNTSKDDNTAVDIAARLSEKYGQAVDRLNNLQVKHQSLLEKDKNSQQQIKKLQLDIIRAEKELVEANAMLKEMQGELKKWKEDVLGFRSEMRESQKALLNGVTRLHVLISGGVAVESPTTQPAPIATNTTP